LFKPFMDTIEKQRKLTQLKTKVAACTRCPLSQTRTYTVPGEGDVDADLMFIGEAPGRNEDLQGKPFVGRAGDVLNKLLNSIQLTRDDIYLCNILKCRPPANRNPLASEIKSCIGSLDLQIKIVNPKVIGTLGNFATAYIFEKFNMPPAKISEVAGKVFDIETPFGPKKIIPVFHPAVAIYNVHKTELLIEHFQTFKPFCKFQDTLSEKIF